MPRSRIASERGAADEPESPSVPDAGMLDTGADAGAFDRRFSGSRFGNVLHDALEHVDFAAWSDWRAGNAPHGTGRMHSRPRCAPKVMPTPTSTTASRV